MPAEDEEAGSGWSWLPASGPALAILQLHLAWRGRHHLLIRVRQATGRPRWLWLEKASDPARWDDLCRAVWGSRALDAV